MNVGILGSGIVGQTLGGGFVRHGHAVMMGTRNPDGKEVRGWVGKTPGASAGTFAEGARFGDLLVLVVLGRIVEKVIEMASPANFTGKTLLDTTNPLADAPPVDGVLPFFTGPNESLGEKIQALLPRARVVKAFNSVGSANMVNPHYEPGPPTMFLCGNDAAAKAEVSGVIRQFGWEPFDCGSILASRSLESVRVIIGRTAGWPLTATTRSVMAPTASTAACGGVMIALNASTWYMPRLLMVKVPPVTSGGRRRPARARSLNSLRWPAISARVAVFAFGITSATTPSLTAAARLMFTSG